jgi:hypothetical protein
LILFQNANVAHALKQALEKRTKTRFFLEIHSCCSKTSVFMAVSTINISFQEDLSELTSLHAASVNMRFATFLARGG